MLAFFNRLNVFGIVREHYATFYDRETEKTNFIELAGHVFLPILLAYIVAPQFLINDKVAATLLSAFAALGGFTLNALVMLSDKRANLGEELTQKVRQKVQLLKETFYNAAFALLISILLIAAAGGILIIAQASQNEGLVALTEKLSFLTHMLLYAYLLTILMVLKRLHSVFQIEY